MNATRQIASRMLDELSDEMVANVISYIRPLEKLQSIIADATNKVKP